MMLTKKYSRSKSSPIVSDPSTTELFPMNPPTAELFSIDRLKKSQNVENYLQKCIPNDQMLEDILNNLSSLHYPCIEFVLNTWMFSEANRNKPFLDTVTNTYEKPLQFIFKYSRNDVLEQVIVYIINNNMVRLFCDANLSEQLIHIVCSSKTRPTELIKRVINIYLENGLRIDCPTKKGFLPLHLIAKNRPHDTELIHFILTIYETNNMDFECATEDEWLLIHFICNEKNFQAIKYILDIYERKGLTLNCRTSQFKTPLIMLCENCGVSSEGVIYMLKLYDRSNISVDHEWYAGIKPLHIICSRGSHYLIEFILNLYLKQKLNFDCPTMAGERVIHLICARGNFPTIKFILDLYDMYNLNLECETINGDRPIFLILRLNNEEASKYIVDLYFKKNLNFSYKKNGTHVLREVLGENNRVISNYILEKVNGKRKRSE